MSHSENNLFRPALSLRDELNDLNALSIEMAELSRTIERNGNAYLAIEALSNKVQERVGAGDWNRALAHQYDTGIFSILKTFGLDIRPKWLTASFEAVDVTQTPDENRAENEQKKNSILGKLFGNITEALGKLLEKGDAFIKRIRSSGVSITKATEKLRKLVEGSSGEPEDPDFVFRLDGNPWIKVLAVGNQRMSASASLDHCRTAGLTVANAWTESYETACVALAAAATKKTPVPKTAIWSRLPDLRKYEKVWPGGVAMKIFGLTDGSDTLASMATARLWLKPVDVATGITAPVLKKNECGAVIDAMAALGKAITDSEKNLTKLQADFKRIQASLAAVKEGEAGADIKLFPKLISVALWGPQIVYPYAAKLCQGVYKYVEASVKTYK